MKVLSQSAMCEEGEREKRRAIELYVVAQPSILLWRKIDDITLYFSLSLTRLRCAGERKALDSPLFVHEATLYEDDGK